MNSTSGIFGVGGIHGTTVSDTAPGSCPAPPPPPPPPPLPAGSGRLPATRMDAVIATGNVIEPITVTQRLRPSSYERCENEAYEPPAAIQNAMMTKDKKPFTYTPGMGGKLDLSQIKSPRMARRVAKNAKDEGIEGPPKCDPAAVPRSSATTGSTLYGQQPRVAIPVFPINSSATLQPVVPSTRLDRVASSVPANGRVSSASNEIKIVPKTGTTITADRPISPPETPTSPVVSRVTLAKAPTPWLRNENGPRDELPEWAKRSSISETPISPIPDSGPHRERAAPQLRHQRHSSPPDPRQGRSSPTIQERVIPVRIEDRPSVFSVKNDPGHHRIEQQPQQRQRLADGSCQRQQRWGNAGNGPSQRPFNDSTLAPSSESRYSSTTSGGTHIVPIIVEGSEKTNDDFRQNPRVIVQRGPLSPGALADQRQQYRPEAGGPVQSRSFRVLQKITDTGDVTVDEADCREPRRLREAEDEDRLLMDKLKERVDGDAGAYPHQEEDPRYRGAAIPSKAFRYLRNITDSGDASLTAIAPAGSTVLINERQQRRNRNSLSFEESQASLPASEQQAPEPKKYTGSAIPSRSFRILQAMTSPESIGPDQSDY